MKGMQVNAAIAPETLDFRVFRAGDCLACFGPMFGGLCALQVSLVKVHGCGLRVGVVRFVCVSLLNGLRFGVQQLVDLKCPLAGELIVQNGINAK